MFVDRLTDAKILIVDDQESNILLVQSQLEVRGYTHFLTTTDPRRALALFAEFQPDLVLLDLHMPEMDGFAVLEGLRGVIPPQSYLPILVLTADTTRQARQRALELGAMDFLTKPLDPTEVHLRVHNLLVTRSLHLYQQNQNQMLEEKVQDRTVELNRQTAHAQALTRTAARLNADLDMQTVLDAVCEETARALNVQAVTITLLNTEGFVAVAADYGLPATFRQQYRPVPLADLLALNLQSQGRAVVVEDVQSTPGLPEAELLRSLDIRTAVGVALQRCEQLIGSLNLLTFRQIRHYDDDELALLEALADQASQAITNARLYQSSQEYAAHLEDRVAERTAQLETANQQLQQAHVEVSQALAQEIELNELKSRFLTTTSHEFRTPLAIILSSAELLDQYSSRLSEEKKTSYLRRIQTSVRHMSRLVTDVLLVEKGRAGQMQFNPKPMDLVTFFQTIIEEFQLDIDIQHQIRLTVEGLDDTTHLPVQMDESLLQHILYNLLSNAVKYSAPGSQVSLNLAHSGDKVRFTVADQGIGIPAEDQSRIFESFHRATNVDDIPGTGLGLSIVKQAVEQHQGSIQMQSQEGHGTTFTVELPLAAEK